MISLINFDLINQTTYPYKRGENLGLACLAAVLAKAGYEVAIHNVSNDSDFNMILSQSPKIIGVNPFIHDFRIASRYCETAKRNLSELFVVWGGIPVTSCIKEVLEDFDAVDYVVRGEGERPFLSLVEALLKGLPVDGIQGIGYRKEDIIKINPPGEIVEDLDLLPEPCHSLLANPGISFARISGSRGCYGACSFCAVPSYYCEESKVRWRGKSVYKIVREIEGIYAKYGVRELFFSDASCEDPPGRLGKKRLYELAQGILSLNITAYYRCFFRAKGFFEKDRELLDILYRSGLEKVCIGIESTTEHMIKRYRKGITIDQCLQTIQLLRDAKILVEVGFIFFAPYTTVEDLVQQTEFLYETMLAKQFTYFLTQLEVYPQTEIRRMLIDDGLMAAETRYDDLYGYQFLNAEVGEIAKTISLFKSKMLFDLLSEESNTELVLNRIRRQYDDTRLETLIGKLSDIQIKMNDYFHQVVRNIIDYHEDAKKIDLMQEEFNNQLSSFQKGLVIIRREMVHLCMLNNTSLSAFNGRIVL